MVVVQGQELGGRIDGGAVRGSRPRRPGAGRQAVVWVLGGLLGGVVWGVVCRLWMRYVSDVPSFSWTGTLFILGVTGLAGLALGVLELLRRRGVGAWRYVALLPALLMFVGQGIPFLPPAVLGSLALSGRGPRWVRVPAAVLSFSSLGLFLLPDVSIPNDPVVTVLWFVAMSAALAVAWTPAWRRRERAATSEEVTARPGS